MTHLYIPPYTHTARRADRHGESVSVPKAETVAGPGPGVANTKRTTRVPELIFFYRTDPV